MYYTFYKSKKRNLWKWRQDDEEESITETDKSPEPVVQAEKPKETKAEDLEKSDYEREDLITRFDRIIRGELDGDLQVWINLTSVRQSIDVYLILKTVKIYDMYCTVTPNYFVILTFTPSIIQYNNTDCNAINKD